MEGGREIIFAMSWGSDGAVSNASSVGEDLPDNEVDLLFSEFLRERIPLRARERGEYVAMASSSSAEVDVGKLEDVVSASGLNSKTLQWFLSCSE
jgi:hypothetical protein